MDSGFQGPFVLPVPDIYKNEKYLFESLQKYFFANKQNLGLRKRGKDFLCNQYLNIGWQYYNMLDMQNFRRCLWGAFWYHPSVNGLVLLFKSLFGRRAMEAISRIRKIFCI
jgi:hypothetical protein